jgi:hypothetical protein
MRWYCLLTTWSWGLLERSLVVGTLNSFPAFYGTQRSNTEFTRALHLSLSWARPLQSTSPHPTSTRSILISSNRLCLGLPSGLLLSGFPTNNPYAFLFSPFVLQPRPSHPPHLINSNNTWCLVSYRNIIKWLVNVKLDFTSVDAMMWKLKWCLNYVTFMK